MMGIGKQLAVMAVVVLGIKIKVMGNAGKAQKHAEYHRKDRSVAQSHEREAKIVLHKPIEIFESVTI
ncbi:hypothetical protein JS84_10415 [Vibrio vulnificus]|nr:hypothetical protein FORC37_0258 [Vibrio vulnificus]ASM96048.1 hypothetical protein AOT11_12535 [Vibrio vulnificus NBRC 15645 = ATCC 27562]AVX00132.1 hypothetical protein BJD94_09660 [Vibrio vulnificus Env1]KFK56070.1 hypothetical protein JS86_06685 [Vibrio vulnificus]KFK60997.1 hypothetical protein JS83_05125 [Vibrio vulnificus]